MRGEANQNVPAISKQAVVGLIVFIANRFFSLSFRVGKRGDRSKERSLGRGAFERRSNDLHETLKMLPPNLQKS